MNCIDFENKIITDLDPQQKEHIKSCSRCRTIWEDQVIDRLIINLPFDPDLEQNVDLSEKPPTGSFITSEFWKDVETHFSDRDKIFKKVDSFLAERFKGNPAVLQKLREVAMKVAINLTKVPPDFDQRFSSALGYFTDQQAETLDEKALIKKMKKKINNYSDSE